MHLLLYPIRQWLSFAVWQQIIIALVIGVATGLLLGEQATVLQPLGILFIHAIQMMVVPVVFTAIVCAVLAVDDLSSMRRVTIKAFVLYVVCMVVATCLGIGIASLIKPGVGFSLAEQMGQIATVAKPPTFAATILAFVPSNPLKAFVEGNIIQILVFGLILGVSIKLAGEPAQPVERFFKSLSSVVFKFAQIIVSFAPYGIFGIDCHGVWSIWFVGINATIKIYRNGLSSVFITVCLSLRWVVGNVSD